MTGSATATDREKAREIGIVTSFWITLVLIAAFGLLFFGETFAALLV